MTVTLNLPPDVEVKITAQAQAHGLSLPDYLLTIIRKHAAEPIHALASTQAQRTKAMLALLDQWAQEDIQKDATLDPAELARREAEWKQFKAAMFGQP